MPNKSLKEMGYKVERVNGKSVAYLVTGQRGARYMLVRNAHRPDHLFSINENHFTSNNRIYGYAWFVEIDKEVFPLR